MFVRTINCVLERKGKTMSSISFKLASQLSGVNASITDKLGDEWPGSVAQIALALHTAGHAPGPELVNTAEAINKLGPCDVKPSVSPDLSGPIKVEFVDSSLRSKGPREWLSMLVNPDNGNRADLCELLTEWSRNRRVICIGDDGNVAIDKTCELKEYVDRNPNAPIGDFFTGFRVCTIHELFAKERELSPVTGEELFDGRSPNGTNWSRVPKELWVLYPFGRLLGSIPSSYTEDQVFNALMTAPLPAPFDRIKEAFDRAQRAGASDEETQRVRDAQRMLKAKDRDQSMSAPAVVAQTFATSQGPLSRDQFKAALIQHLLQCPTMSRNRDGVVRDLTFGNVVEHSGVPRIHVTNIVESCLEHPNGVGELVERLRFWERGTIAFTKLCAFLNVSA